MKIFTKHEYKDNGVHLEPVINPSSFRDTPLTNGLTDNADRVDKDNSVRIPWGLWKESVSSCDIRIRNLEKHGDLYYDSFSYNLDVVKRRLDSCGSMARITTHCLDCGDTVIQSVAISCQIRFCNCSHCVKMRITKAKRRLMQYAVKTDRMIHLVIGFKPMPHVFKQHKKTHEKVMGVFYKELKKVGQEFKGLRVYDFQDNDYSYLHYHHALLPGYGSYDTKLIHKARGITEKKTGVSFIVKIIGWRNRKGLFNYFAKRMAGQYGEKGNYFYLSDVMTMESFVENFYRVRSLVVVSRRLSCILVPVSFQCKRCGSDFCYVKFSFVVTCVVGGDSG